MPYIAIRDGYRVHISPPVYGLFEFLKLLICLLPPHGVRQSKSLTRVKKGATVERRDACDRTMCEVKHEAVFISMIK